MISPTCSPRWATPRRPERPSLGPSCEVLARALYHRPLLPWQASALDVALEVDPERPGRFAYPVVVWVVPRRAGKTAAVLVKSLRRLLAAPRRAGWYTAQTREDAAKQFRDEWVPTLERSRLAAGVKVRRAQGSEGFTVPALGSRLQLFPPTVNALHGQNADDATIDEAWSFTLDGGEAVEAGVRPAQLTRPGRQLWIVTAGGTEFSTWLDAWMERGREAVDAELDRGVCYLEYSADPAADDYDPGDPALWARTHPGVGHLIALDALRDDWTSMSRAGFERSILNVWPRRSAGAGSGIDAATWAEHAGDHVPAAPFTFAADVSADRSRAAIAVAGAGVADGTVVEVVDTRAGSSWVVGALRELRARHRGARVVIDGLAAAGIAADLERARVPFVETGPSEMARACAAFVDDANAGAVWHRGQGALDAALAGARRRPVGDGGFAWSRARSEGVDLSPLVAVTLATWGHRTRPPAGRAAVATSSP